MDILIYVRIYFFDSPLLLKGRHVDSQYINKLLWGVKMENGVFGKMQKRLDTKL